MRLHREGGALLLLLASRRQHTTTTELRAQVGVLREWLRELDEQLASPPPAEPPPA